MTEQSIEEKTAKSFGEQFRETLVATWKPRLQELKGWGKAFLLAAIPVIALDICVAMPFLALTIVTAVGIPMAVAAFIAPENKMKNTWSETKALYRESFDFVKKQLSTIFSPAQREPELPRAVPATEVSSFHGGSSRQAFNQEKRPAGATAGTPAPERLAAKEPVTRKPNPK